MMDSDILQRFLFENLNVRGVIVRLTNSFQTIKTQHAYPEVVSELLGEALSISVLLNAIIKLEGHLTVQFRGKDPLSLLMAQCNDNYNIRGLVKYKNEISTKQDLISALKNGILSIVIQPEKKFNSYQGIVNWHGQSLADSVEAYFKNSEQLPTRLWLAVNQVSAVGMLLQTLPAESQRKSTPVSETDDFMHLVHLTETITPQELLELANETIIHRLYSQEEVKLFEPTSVQFACHCSLEKSENAIRILGEAEALEEIKEKKYIIVTCEFCNKEYSFDRVDVATIFKNGNTSSQIH